MPLLFHTICSSAPLLGGWYLSVEDLAQFHSEVVRGFLHRIVSERNFCTMTLYVSPFVLRHHKCVLAAGKDLTYGLAV